MQTDILIAGAGLSGLALASALHEAGVPCLLAEARERVGGRILTLESSHTASGVIHADIGPSWIWPGQARVASLLQQLDLEVFEQYRMMLRRNPRNGSGSAGKRGRADRARNDQQHRALAVTVSIGYAERKPTLKLPEAVIKAADTALYRAKQQGRNRLGN